MIATLRFYLKTMFASLRTFWINLRCYGSTISNASQLILLSLLGICNRSKTDRILQNWSRYLLKTLGCKYQIINPEQVCPQKNRPTILMCNHSSSIDIMLSFQMFPGQSIRHLAKAELAKIPIFGRGMQIAEFPFITRQNRQKALNDMKQVKALLDSGIVVMIYPEGTRSENGALMPFKKGGMITAIESQAEIIPIAIRGAHAFLAPKTRRPDPSAKVRVFIGKPIDASAYRIEEKGLLCERVETAIAELLKSE